MSTLVTVLKKEEIIILNRNYSKQQLREKLSGTTLYSKNWIEHVLKKGIFIPEGFAIIVKSKHATIERNYELVRNTIEWNGKKKIAIYPDGEFEIISSVWKGNNIKLFPKEK